MPLPKHYFLKYCKLDFHKKYEQMSNLYPISHTNFDVDICRGFEGMASIPEGEGGYICTPVLYRAINT